MGTFESRLLEFVNNENGFIFYKLLIDDVCYFDLFVEKLRKYPRDAKSLDSIFAYMDSFSKAMLPQSKFRQIKNVQRKDIFEFKKGNIRVYVILQDSDIYVIAGGFKNEQKQDVQRIARQVKQFKI